ncbi:lipid A-modifier LpxR family protein [Shewanella benthica]|nr:lipid A-modifier LpxR family protein [Shewanella benthica]
MRRTGPASANEQVQSFVHEVTGSSTPQGWQPMKSTVCSWSIAWTFNTH